MAWRNEKRGDFGWSVEGDNEIKSFWLKDCQLEKPGETIGRLAPSSITLLNQKVAEYSSEITPRVNISWKCWGGSLKAFRVSESIGGGCEIAYPVGLDKFKTIAIEAPSSDNNSRLKRLLKKILPF